MLVNREETVQSRFEKMSDLKILIHLPKCSGTTISTNLRRHLGSRFFHYIRGGDHEALAGHIANGFANVDVMMIHNSGFPYQLLPKDLDIEYMTITREPISAAVSMYNFATNAAHTRNYHRVKGMSFWQFYAYCHKINIWHPNFQTYYLCGRRQPDVLKRFINRYQVKLYRMKQAAQAYTDLTGLELDPSLDRNRAPNYHKLDDALDGPVYRAESQKNMLTVQDLSEQDTQILKELFDLDLRLWRMAGSK